MRAVVLLTFLLQVPDSPNGCTRENSGLRTEILQTVVSLSLRASWHWMPVSSKPCCLQRCGRVAGGPGDLAVPTMRLRWPSIKRL